MILLQKIKLFWSEKICLKSQGRIEEISINKKEKKVKIRKHLQRRTTGGEIHE